MEGCARGQTASYQMSLQCSWFPSRLVHFGFVVVKVATVSAFRRILRSSPVSIFTIMLHVHLSVKQQTDSGPIRSSSSTEMYSHPTTRIENKNNNRNVMFNTLRPKGYSMNHQV
jgi:hypothetical protein